MRNLGQAENFEANESQMTKIIVYVLRHACTCVLFTCHMNIFILIDL